MNLRRPSSQKRASVESPDRKRRSERATRAKKPDAGRSSASEIGDSPVKPSLAHREKRRGTEDAPVTPQSSAYRQRRAEQQAAPRSSYKEMHERRAARAEAQNFDDYG